MIDSQKTANSFGELTGLSRRNGEIFLVFDHKKLVPPTLDVVLEVLTPDLIRKLFCIVYTDGQYFVVDTTQKLLKFPCDPYDPRIREKFGIDDEKMESLQMCQENTLSEIIPKELRDQFCLLDGKEVVYSTKSSAEFRMARFVLGSSKIIYVPPQM